jgi:thymidylate synthase
MWIMRIIRAPSISRAHELVIKMILEKGYPLVTEDEEATIEFEEVAMKVDNPFTEPLVSPASRFQKRFMEQYARDLIKGSGSVFEYDYHGRLFHWGDPLMYQGVPVEIDQVSYIVKKLSSSHRSRRALAITWNPVTDEELANCPCLQLIQCIIRDNKLQMKVVFRSNDMLTASGANMFALVHLQQHIAGKLGILPGSYTHIALVPHIYYKRDINDIEPFCRKGELIRPVKEVCRICKKCPGYHS